MDGMVDTKVSRLFQLGRSGRRRLGCWESWDLSFKKTGYWERAEKQ